MSKIKIIDNYIPDVDYKNILDIAFSTSMTWNYGTILPFQKSIDNSYSWPKETPLEYNSQNFHVIFNRGNKSPFYNLIAKPVIDVLNPSKLVKVKLNLNPCVEKIFLHGYHVDNHYENCKTAVYYLNSNDGYTMFESGEKVESVANRIVIFPSYMKHCGTSCTNTHARLIMNINFFKD